MENNGFLKDMVLAFAGQAENAVAFSLYDGRQVTQRSYRQFGQDILLSAAYFAEKGISGRNIALAGHNSYAWFVSFFAILAGGNVPVLINPDAPQEVLQWQCAKAEISLICAEDVCQASLQAVCANIPCVAFTRLSGTAPLSPEAVHGLLPEDTAVMIFTSGTTGKSKAVELTSDNLLYGLKNFDRVYAHIEAARIMTPIPAYHVLGFTHILKTLSCRKTVCLGRGIGYLFMDMQALNPSVLNAVPSVLESLAKLLRKAATPQIRQRYIGRDLQIITYGGAAIGKAIVCALLDQGFLLYSGYGMTEVTGGVAWCQISPTHPEAGGKFCPHVRYRFLDGELLLAGPARMKGYYKDPEATAAIIRDQWLHTGDLGHCDPEGYLCLTGRKKNIIILSNGENVSPEEIEEMLCSFDPIAECLVYSDGKVICADIHTADPEAAAACVRIYNEDMPMYRQISKVNYEENPLPRTDSGKLKRKENVL